VLVKLLGIYELHYSRVYNQGATIYQLHQKFNLWKHSPSGSYTFGIANIDASR